jgi:hypothetical protein
MDERTSVAHVARGVSFLWTQTLTTTLFQVVAFALIARLISTSQMGLLAILSLMLSLAQLIAPLALPSAIVRFVAKELARGQRQNGAALFYKSTTISIAISTIMGAACMAIVALKKRKKHPYHDPYLPEAPKGIEDRNSCIRIDRIPNAPWYQRRVGRARSGIHSEKPNLPYSRWPLFQ